MRPILYLGLPVLLAMTVFSAEPASPCDEISKDVTAAIEKDSSKLLMIVEDALVINESCACEIIKAAILAAHADAGTVNQIVQTAISVAPKMSGVIMDCASAVAPGAVVSSQPTTAADAKNPGKNPVPVAPVEEDFKPVPSSIRGVYLIQPPASGFVPCDPNFRKCCSVCTSPTVATTP